MKTLAFSTFLTLLSFSVVGQVTTCQLLITGEDSEHLVSLNGEVNITSNIDVHEYHEIYDNKIYYLQGYEEAKFIIHDLTTGEVTDITIDTVPIPYFNKFKIVDNSRIALLDNRNDLVYFIDYEGSLLAISFILNPSSNNLQNTNADILNNELIVSENGNNQLVAIDLDTYQSRIFKDLSPYTSSDDFLGRIKVFNDVTYVTTRSKIFSLTEDTSPIELIDLGVERNISGFDVLGEYLFFQTNFWGNIYYADLNTNEVVLIASEFEREELSDLSILSENCIDIANEISEASQHFFELFPNPASDRVFIKGDYKEDSELVIYSISGCIVTRLSNPKEIDVSTINNGLYITEIRNVNREVLFRGKLIVN